jgi:UDP-glucose:(heptosyl)LPS alpha-1,3-glucosyltransferase
MIRIAIVRQKYHVHGGAERFVSRMLAVLAKRTDIDVTVIAREWRDAGCCNVRLINPWYLTRTGRDMGFARDAAACFGEFDLVQSHERIAGTMIYRAGDGVHATWLEQLARVHDPSVPAPERPNGYHRYVLGAEDALFSHPALKLVICNSRMVANDIQRRFGLADERVVLIYNGVDIAAFNPELSRYRWEWRRLHQVPQDKPLLAFVGSGFLRKGLGTALAAIAAHRDVHLVVAGSDKHQRRYLQDVERLGLAARVRFLGVVSDVKPLYGAADALILPTLYDPFSNACLEAFAAGLPVFTSPSCGAAEWVVPAENGWVVDALDAEGYSAAIAAWLEHRDAWPVLRGAARATAEPYTLERMVDQHIAAYTRLLASA